MKLKVMFSRYEGTGPGRAEVTLSYIPMGLGSGFIEAVMESDGREEVLPVCGIYAFHRQRNEVCVALVEDLREYLHRRGMKLGK